MTDRGTIKLVLLKVAFILLFATPSPTLAQIYAVPTKIPLERITRRTFPDYFGRRNRYPALVPEQFFPIGWSRDGKFAYYVEPVDEACGCYYANLSIVDLVTDKVLWEFKYDQQDRNTGEMFDEDTIQKLWKKNKKLFSEKLAEHGINASRVSMLGKTFRSGIHQFTAKATPRMGRNADGYEDRVNLYTISLTSPKLGSKTVFTSEDHTKEDYWFILDADVLGVLRSPYDDRVAIIAMEVMRGYEGPPHTGDVRVIGAHLANGFSRK